ncbi:MAG: NAD(P)H-hydrate dehydratase [Actinomycetota bacterium]|nr:NAD(P)H-hydrate dehydratase [Actinomycetota bacterium]
MSGQAGPGGFDIGCGADEWSRDEYRALIPHPDEGSNKYSRGSVLVMGGSEAYPGSVMLAARGAQRAGAGYVRIAAPRSIAPILQGHDLTVPVTACPQGSGALVVDAADEVLSMKPSSAYLLGPGLTVNPQTTAFCVRMLAEVGAPFVVDADGLNVLAASEEARAACRARTAITVLTPHEGEMARLLAGLDGAHAGMPLRTDADRVHAAQLVADGLRCICVLKGHRTFIASADSAVLCAHGTPALATAGTGDVLAGMVAAFLAQGLAPMQASSLGVYLHACAGRLASAEQGPISVTVDDVVAAIGPAVRQLVRDGS